MQKLAFKLVFILMVSWLLIGVQACAADDELGDLQSPLTNEWRLVRDDQRHNIQSYIKREDGLTYRSFRVTAVLDCNPKAIYKVLLDFENYQKWYWEVKNIKLLSRLSSREYYIYLVHNAPFGLSDRDVVLHATIQPSTYKQPMHVIRIKAVQDSDREASSLIRMKAEDMVISFYPLSRDKTQIEVEGYIDPGSDASSWAVNLIQRRAPYANMLGLARIVKRDAFPEGTIDLPPN